MSVRTSESAEGHRSGENAAPAARTLADRLLAPFTHVRPGEGRTVLILALSVLLLLCAYYLIKPLREGWLAVSVIRGLSKMEVKAYSGFGQTLLLAGLMTGYGRLATRWSRETIITRSTLFCVSNMVVFWLLQPDFFVQNLPGTGVLFYLWVGMFGVFIVAQFWAFAADLYDDERGRRLIPAIAIGATGGAVIGSWLAERLVAAPWFPTEHLLIAAIVPLLAALALIQRVARQGPLPSPSPPAAQSLGPDPVATDPLGLVLRSPLLLAMGVVTALLSWVNTNGENILFRVVQEVVEAEAATGDPTAAMAFVREATTRFYGDFFFWVNVVALVLQAFVASRLLRYGGFGAIFLLLPVIGLLSYGAMALLPVLAVIRVMKVAENATSYSISNTARHVFWLPLPRNVIFQGKPMVDSLFARLGDGLAALTVLVGVQLLGLPLVGFIGLNVALLVVWLGVAGWIVRRHHRLTDGEASGEAAAA